MTTPFPPLTDEQFEQLINVIYDVKLGRRTPEAWYGLNDMVEYARWHRAELAKARAENERLRTIMDDVLKQFDDLHERLHDPDNTFEGFSVAVNACGGRIKEARAPEKEGG